MEDVCNLKSVNFTVEKNVKCFNEGELFRDPFSYRWMVGVLIYLTVMRQYITYLMHILSRFMHALLKPHMYVAMRIL